MTELTDQDHNQALIHWTGYAGNLPSDSIFILTRQKSGQDIIHSSFYRSTDYGKTWKSENTKFKDSGLAKAENVLHSFVISSIDKKKVIFLESMHARKTGPLKVWISDDEGETFESATLPENVELVEMKFHPTRVDWVLGYDRRHQQLWFSENFGHKWSRVAEKVTPDRYFWYEPEVDTVERHADFEKLVHFETQTVNEYEEEEEPTFEFKSCLIPDCSSAGEFYENLNSFTRFHSVAESSLMIQDKFIFFEMSNGNNVAGILSYY